jgi:soluble lytic murein transglycosylase
MYNIHKTMNRFLMLLVIMFLPSDLLAGEECGKAYFVHGLERMESGEYEGAIKDFSEASEKLPIIGDHAILYISKIHLMLGNIDQSLKVLAELLEKYPDTPLRKEAKAIEIENSILGNRDNALMLLDVYTNEYPSDMEMMFMHGEFLRNKGYDEEARSVFKEIYIEGGDLAQDAYKEIKPLNLSHRELHARAANLIKYRKYKEAVSALSDARKTDDETLRKEILEKLGLALFRQKKYKLAADAYLKAGDLFMAAKSFFRAGKEKAFRKTLKRMIKARDDEAAELMIAEADDLRRKGETAKALEIFSRVMDKFPSATEDALWWTGWAHYKKSDYLKAVKAFDKLYLSYPSGKYLYWKAKSLEKAGEEASDVYARIDDDGFYGFLARLRTSGETPVSIETRKQEKHRKRNPSDRIDILIELGLIDEAARELNLAASKTTNRNKLMGIAFRLVEAERYNDAIHIALRLPYDKCLDEILYPLAFWPTVNKVSSSYSIDPFLLLSLMREESRFDRKALSRAGAIGLMQLMPETAERTSRKLRIKLEDTDSIYETDANIKLGAHYFNALIREFNSVSAALAAYNAGESRVRQWLKNGNYASSDEFIEDIPYRETRQYVKRIISTYYRYKNAEYPQLNEGLRIL